MTTPSPDPEATARVVDSDLQTTPRTRGRESQFAPGTIIAGRYRIASILGSGGMGEVYRADDTKLDQTVALKFLPARLARDPVLLARLHDEVRLGRQIAHPNVCRIYDIVEAGDAHFVAMEFVDGEDLARLLRRIGRIAHDKAVDIARGIAAGLMAAHGKGILHRDLKPANVMIDSRGDARIMDFGLALADDEDDDTIAGTPAYMAPELFDGQPATVQSDLYALGLVMYELFTGKRAHNARSMRERMSEITSEITTPSNIVRDIDSSVERVILRCLNHDPTQRPRSAREVIETLGGDPLAAAMAAGDTPSPRVVAAAGTAGTLKPAIAWTLLLSIFATIAFALFLTYRGGVFRRALQDPPEVHAARASDTLRKLGIPKERFASYGFAEQYAYSAWIFANDRSPKRWDRLYRGLPVFTFWMREQHQPLLNTAPVSSPKPSAHAPPMYAPGSVRVETDTRGRLYSLAAIASPDWKRRPLDWNELLDAAGLRGATLLPAEPRTPPPTFADARMAWTGKHPEDGTPIRIEAAAYRGVPVMFRITAPWNEVAAESAFSVEGFLGALTVLLVLVIVLCAVLAWRNLRQRRGDRTGALRVGLLTFLITLALDLLVADHEAAATHERNIVTVAISHALLWGVVMTTIYLAIEPYIRRRWPDRLISWQRLISGNWRDPMVARDVLIGIAGGLLHAIAPACSFYLKQLTTGLPAPPATGNISSLDSVATGIANIAGSLHTGIVMGLVLMTVLMLLTIVLRKRALAAIGVFVLHMVAYWFASQDVWMYASFILIAIIQTILVARFGLLAIVVANWVFGLIFFYPLPDGAAWYTFRASLMMLFTIALAVWAFRTSLGGQSAFASD